MRFGFFNSSLSFRASASGAVASAVRPLRLRLLSIPAKDFDERRVSLFELAKRLQAPLLWSWPRRRTVPDNRTRCRCRTTRAPRSGDRPRCGEARVPRCSAASAWSYRPIFVKLSPRLCSVSAVSAGDFAFSLIASAPLEVRLRLGVLALRGVDGSEVVERPRFEASVARLPRDDRQRFLEERDRLLRTAERVMQEPRQFDEREAHARPVANLAPQRQGLAIALFSFRWITRVFSGLRRSARSSPPCRACCQGAFDLQRLLVARQRFVRPVQPHVGDADRLKDVRRAPRRS